MGIGAEEARRLSWWEYDAMITVWNERHSEGDDGEPVAAPDLDLVRRRHERLAEQGVGRMH